MQTDHTDQDIGANGVAAIHRRRDRGVVGWGWSLAMTFVRLPLIVVGLTVAATFYARAGEPQALRAALVSSAFIMIFVNLVSLALLVALTRREGIGLADLIAFDRTRLWRDVRWGLVLVVLLNVPFVIAVVVTALVINPPATAAGVDAAMETVFVGGWDGTLTVGPPVWMAVLTAVLFPLLNPVIEELHYRGYVQPRLEALSGSAAVGVTIMAIGFALQHATYALTVASGAVFVVAFLVWGVGAGIVYHRQRRLTSLIVVHVVVNVSFAVIPLFAALAP